MYFSNTFLLFSYIKVAYNSMYSPRILCTQYVKKD